MTRRALETTRGRLVLLLAAVFAVLLASAALAHYAFDEYDGFGDSLWSATLHLLDPSSLHEDEGAAQRTIGLFQVVTGLVLLVGLLFTFVAEVVATSLERIGQTDRPVHAEDHLLIVGGLDQVGIAATAAADAHEEVGLERLVVLAPESARESREGILSDLRGAAGSLKVNLVFGDTAGGTGFELGSAETARAILVGPSTSGHVAAETADVEVTQSGLALLDYLRLHEVEPDVRLLFRRGRNVDASWELFPDDWDAVVGDRTISGLVRLALTRPTALAALPGWDEEHRDDSEFPRLVGAAWERASREQRRLRLTIVGCGINTPSTLEDLAAAGRDRFEVTLIAPRSAYETFLGTDRVAGLAIDFVADRRSDPNYLQGKLAAAEPDIVLVTPSPTNRDLRSSDASATLAIFHTMRCTGPSLPIFAEVFLPETARRLPEDRRVVSVSTLRAVGTAVALSLFAPDRAIELERQINAGAPDP
jgi:hypothetical protein